MLKFTKTENKRTGVRRTEKYGETAFLCQAAREGSSRALKKLLKNGAPVDECHGKYGKTALHEAAKHDRLACVKILLEQHADINKASFDGTRPIHEALEKGFVDCLVALLNHCAEPDATTNRTRWTALHIAARNSHRQCLKVLLQHGADANATALGGLRPLHLATSVFRC